MLFVAPLGPGARGPGVNIGWPPRVAFLSYMLWVVVLAWQALRLHGPEVMVKGAKEQILNIGTARGGSRGMTSTLRAAPMAPPRRAIRCAGCRAFVPEHQWLALELAETIDSVEVTFAANEWDAGRR